MSNVERDDNEVDNVKQPRTRKSIRITGGEDKGLFRVTRGIKEPGELKERFQNVHDRLKKLGQEIEIEIGTNLEKKLQKIGTIFSNEDWLKKLEASPVNQVDTPHSRTLDSSSGEIIDVEEILNQVREAGQEARKKGHYDAAIGILHDVNDQIIPVIKSLPIKLSETLRSSFFDELCKTYLEKGNLAAAIECIECRVEEDTEEITQFKSQIDKGHLLTKRGEFNNAINHFQDLLKTLPEEGTTQVELSKIAEARRGLAIAYRGKGSFKEAFRWFKEARDLYQIVNDQQGWHGALWGMGIAHYLRGEWEIAIQIWEQLIKYYQSLSESADEDHKGKPVIFDLTQIYFEYTRTLEMSGRLIDAEEMLTRLSKNLDEYDTHFDHTELYRARTHLYKSDLLVKQGQLDLASIELEKAKTINIRRQNEKKICIQDLTILESEVTLLLSQNRADEARKKLETQKEHCKSNWDKAQWNRLLFRIEKAEMNYGSAKRAIRNTLEIVHDIGASPYSDELLMLELLVEMAMTGNRRAFEEAQRLVADFYQKFEDNNLTTLTFECKLLEGHLHLSNNEYEKALQIFATVSRDAKKLNLHCQKDKALEELERLEQQGQQMGLTRELSVYRYAEDARRILNEYS